MAETAAPRRSFPVGPALLLGAWAAAVPLWPPLAALPVVVALMAWMAAAASRWLAAFFLVALLAPPLPFALGNSGPHVAPLFAFLGLLAGAWRFGEWRFRPSPCGAALLLFYGAVFASLAPAALHSGPAVALESTARALLAAIAAYVFFWTADGPPVGARVSPRFLFGLAVASAAFACVDFFLQLPAPAGYGPQFVWLESGVFRRAQGVFYEASTLGNLCVCFLVMAAVAASKTKSIRFVSTWALASGAAILAAGLILSYSRASVINLVVALTALAVLERRRLRLPSWRAVAVFGVVAASAALPFGRFLEEAWVRLSGTVVFFFDYTESLLSGRVETWRTIFAYLAGHPLEALAGVGYKTLPYTDVLGKPVVADNMYLALLAETGVLGLAALLLLNAALLGAGWRAARSADPEASFWGTWLFCFWLGECVQMASGDLLTYWRVLPVYFYIAGRVERVARENAR